MRREDLEHLIWAACAVTNQYEVVVIGSQSILGAVPDAPAELLQSKEADLYPLADPTLADLIDGAIGEGSPFEERFGYYAQGVGPGTATLPEGWQKRLVRLQNQGTDLRVGWCLDPADLAASKLAAGRDKDWVFVEVMLKHQIVDAATVRERIETLPIDSERRGFLVRWVEARSALGWQPAVRRR